MEASPPRLITIGETMALVRPAHAEPLDAATSLRLDVAGAESNVASHVASLGHPAAWLGCVGDDALGRKVVRVLHERGVDTRWVQVDPDASTGVMFKDPGNRVRYYREGSAASRMDPRALAPVRLELADFVHVSGITPALSASCAALTEATIAATSGTACRLSFDVNHRDVLWGAARAAPALHAIAQRADLVFVGLDEARALWGTATPHDVRALIDGPARLVVKDGDVGATEFSPDGVTFAPAVPTEVVEAVGAGDAFAGAYLAACLSGLGPMDRLTAAHARAALVLQTTSDFVEVTEPLGQTRGAP